MQEVVQGTVSSFGTELSPGLEFVKGNWHSDLEFFCERGCLSKVLDSAWIMKGACLSNPRTPGSPLGYLTWKPIEYWTSEWANKMQLLG
ncbi:unnamed protein product [Rhizophagus irregularis]|nr:unnamed protein product [Rhizophagus irregularis]